MRKLFFAFIIFICLSPQYNASAQVDPARQWPSYRGYMSSGVLDNANLPDNFDPVKMTNVKWKVKVPGLGISSPVIWGDRLFITTAVSQSDKYGFKPGIYGDGTSVGDSSVHEWKVLCYDKNSGKLLWEKTAYKGIPAIKRHPKSTHANPSIATNGRQVIAFFGSEGLYCYDINGNLQWKKNFGILKAVAFDYPSAEWEFASSPVIYNGVVIVQCDVLENSFVAAFDAKTGKEFWKIARDDNPAWSTPNVYKAGDKAIVVVNGFKHMGGYDLTTGKEIWRLSGGGDVPIPTPVVGHDLIFLNSSHGKNSPIFAVSITAVGDISLQNKETSNQYIKWSIPRGGSYIHSLLFYRNRLYNVNWNGIVNCIDPSSGKEIYRGKLGNSKSFISSPVASDGRIYIVDEEGIVYIIKDGDEFRVLSEIPLNDICMTAPAITDGTIFFRTQHYLIAAGKK
jgi:outer membrane protein assembly factor BamB